MQLQFIGAAREVTGSAHLLRVHGRTILLDCGLFQGRRAESATRNRDFPVAPPWRIGLIDLDDGVRVMGHLDAEAVIGARVRGQMRDFAGALVPGFDTLGTS